MENIRLKILAADDNRTNLLLIATLLGRMGHQVVTAQDGNEAVRCFRTEQPDLVLLDVVMPGMDGLAVARQIKGLAGDRWVPIIFLSALDRKEDLMAGLDAGGDDYLAKPIDVTLLEAKIRSTGKALEMQHRARDAYAQLKAISDNLLDALVITDISGRIVSCNQVTGNLFGWQPAELLGNHVNKLIPNPDRGRPDGFLRDHVQDSSPSAMGSGTEVSVQRKDGSVFPAELAVTEMCNDAGERLCVGLIRNITERKQAQTKLLENAAALQRYYDQAEEENQLAVRLLDKQMLRPGLQDPAISYWLMPAKDFSGDVVAAVRGADGSLYALLGDATGHGLTAAISTLPLITVFYGVAARGLSLELMAHEMNRHLRDALPTGHFVAAMVVNIAADAASGKLWSGGMPPAALLDANGKVIESFHSAHLPLGILAPADFEKTTLAFTCPRGSQILLHSDGLSEAENPEGLQLGTAPLLKTLEKSDRNNRLTAIQERYLRHLAGTSPADDVSVMLIDCDRVTSP